jgi:hypothetical protein
LDKQLQIDLQIVAKEAIDLQIVAKEAIDQANLGNRRKPTSISASGDSRIQIAKAIR